MIDLDLIVLLDTVRRRGTVAAAAEELDRVPSALSYTIQKYEDALGFALFKRQGRSVGFTEAGKLLLERGLPLLQQANQLRDEAETLARGREPRLRIAVEAWLTLDAIAPALADLYSTYPDIEVQVYEEALSGTWEALIEGRVDVAVGAPTPKPGLPGIQTDVIGTVEAVFAVAPAHQLAASQHPVTLEQMVNERWVILRDTARSWVPREVLGFSPKRRLMVGSMRDKIAAQVAGLGVGFLPRQRVASLLASGDLVAVDLKDNRVPSELLLAWRTDSRGEGLQHFVLSVTSRLKNDSGLSQPGT